MNTCNFNGNIRMWAVRDEVGGWFYKLQEVKEIPGLEVPVMVEHSDRLLMSAPLVQYLFQFLKRKGYKGWKAEYVGRI